MSTNHKDIMLQEYKLLNRVEVITKGAVGSVGASGTPSWGTPTNGVLKLTDDTPVLITDVPAGTYNRVRLNKSVQRTLAFPGTVGAADAANYRQTLVELLDLTPTTGTTYAVGKLMAPRPAYTVGFAMAPITQEDYNNNPYKAVVNMDIDNPSTDFDLTIALSVLEKYMETPTEDYMTGGLVLAIRANLTHGTEYYVSVPVTNLKGKSSTGETITYDIGDSEHANGITELNYSEDGGRLFIDDIIVSVIDA